VQTEGKERERNEERERKKKDMSRKKMSTPTADRKSFMEETMKESLLSTGQVKKPAWSVWRLSPVYYAVLIHFVCDGVVIAMMPIFMIRELGLMVSTVGVVATAYNVGRTASSLPSGPVIQKLGPRLSMCLACACSVSPLSFLFF